MAKSDLVSFCGQAGVRVNAVCPGPVEGERIEQVMDMHMQGPLPSRAHR